MKKSIKKFIFSSPQLYSLYVKYYMNMNSMFYKGKYVYEIKDIVVCGMQRSGSTLLFNIINEVLKENKHKEDTFFEEERLYKKLLQQELSTSVKKNHTYLPMVASRVKKGLSIGFFTHRDIRDVIVSSIQKGWLENVEEWVENERIRYMANNALLYAKTPNMNVISYEKLMNDKEAVIKEVATALGISLSERAIADINSRTSIENTKKKLAAIPEEKKLLYTDQLHKNHIADGKTGKWVDDLSADEIKVINELTKDFLLHFGYDTAIDKPTFA